MPTFETDYDIEAKTYAALFHTAWHLLDSAEKRAEGRLLDLQAAAVFFAFSFEAYLNHVGAEEIPFWEDIERISHKDKLSALSKHLGFIVDKSKAPFKTVKELFELRNGLAHGRTQRLKKRVVSKTQPAHDEAWRILPSEKLTITEIRRFHDDISAAIEAIDEKRPKPDTTLWSMGSRGFSRKVR
jgi:hypothetical protein